MKKTVIYASLVLLMIGLVYFIVIKNKHQKEGPILLKDRVGLLSQSAEWPATKQKATELLAKIELDKEDEDAKLKLAELYIQEARITGDHVYYDKAAMHYVNMVLMKDSTNFEAVTYKSLIYLSQNNLQDGLNYSW